ncbi:MAG TPA: aminotransferase class IV [Opitutaceae bacterium]|jgi:branched-subunit amino acid aminotransferase/4-amino-4-deoxychorismate lyase|nr:aminotransferase class IV [Opitutaceae bacterium]
MPNYELPTTNCPRQRYVILNGRLLDAGEARISPLGDGFMFGLGLFETIKVLNGRPVFFSDHFERLRRSAGELSLPFTATADELRTRCEQCVSANGLGEGSLKIVVFQDMDGPGELIATREKSYLPEHYERGFALKTFPAGQREGKLFGLKTVNYLGNLQAKQAAVAAGCDEALFIDSAGQILEGSTSNVFVVKGGEVLTPPLDGRILPGIARSRVLQLLKNGRECAVPSQSLSDADEVFVTNALLGVMPVSAVDQQRYDLNHNPVTKALMEAYRRLQLQSVE